MRIKKVIARGALLRAPYYTQSVLTISYQLEIIRYLASCFVNKNKMSVATSVV